MDAATVLEQYVSDLANLPAELAHILEEIGDRDIKFYESRKRIQQRDNSIHKHIKAHGSLADNPKEDQLYSKIRSEFEKAMQLQQNKMDLSNTGLYIIAKHLKRLNDDIKKLENDGLLSTINDDEDSDARLSVPASNARTRVNSVSRRDSPAPSGGNSRSATPQASSSRPTKRQKTSSAAAAAAVAADVSESGGVTAGSAASAVPAVVLSETKNPYARQPQPQAILGADEEEALYCTCQQVSFGNMVACDNPDCQYEWFHYDCVGLTAPPSGTWYCPSCSKERKEKDFKDTTKRKRA